MKILVDKIKISVVVTVLNEAETILALLYGLLAQTKQPAEIIIVDAGSCDKTVQLIELFIKKYHKLPLKIFTQEGNRSMGRNWGIKQTTYDWIAITDAGCVPHRDWLEKLALKAVIDQADVVAGYYDAAPETAFQKAVTPYMLVMPDKVHPELFLPATRSMLMKKEVWKKVGGFDEALRVSEDYDFAYKLLRAKFKLTFTDQAKVSWWPIETLNQFYQTVQDMARYDAKARITRVKTYLVFCRYLIFLLLALVFFCSHWLLGLGFITGSTIVYAFWSIWKNVQYVDRGWFYLSVLQVVSDWGVMVGTVKGLIIE